MTTLPPRLRERLDALALRVRRLRRLRGASLLVLALAGCAALAVLADLALALPGVVRVLDLALWIALGTVVAFVSLIRPLRRQLAPADLAAVVERQYPELQERLTSSVELASSDSPPTGLVARLLSETDEYTQALDFDAAVPSRPARRLGIAAGVVVALALLPAAFAPTEYGRLASRFFVPWHSPADFAFVVHPGDTIAARGRPLTVRITLVPRDPSLALPRYCSLILEQTRLDLVADGDDPATYRVTFPVAASCRYRAEAGKCVSMWYTLTAVAPTDLAPDSPTIVVTPPAEAASFAETQTLAGMVDVTAFAGSEIVFRFAFDRPATVAVLEWTPEGKPTQSIPLALADDARSATWSLRATHAGAYRLVIAGERGIETGRDGGRIAVRPLPEQKDAPPELAKKDADAKERIEDLASRQKELADRAAGAKTDEEADEIAKAQAELARELDRLTQEESSLKEALDSALADRAKALAEDQRDLARAADETERKHDAEHLADVAERQRDLQKRVEALAKETAAPVRANFARPLNDDATKAAESMERGETQQALDTQDRAARDLDRLARDLARLADAAKDAREAVRQLSRLQDDIAKRTREEADRKDDRPLAERLKDLLREQQALRRAVGDLGSKAAEKALAKGDAKEALAAMESARLALRASANKMKADEKSDKPSSLLPSEEQAKKARELAAEQRALRQEAKDAAAKANRERRADASEDKARAEQQAMQEALALRAGALGKDLGKMPAAKEVRKAEAAMKAAQEMAKQGDAASARAMREQAAKALEQAARPGKGGAAGQSVQEARDQMGRAEEQLGKGSPKEASAPMKEAASRLRLAGKQLARSGSAPGVAVDARMFPKELTPHVGKRWGDLPGDLRTRLVQQMKARYGDDYARSIKLYFEQLADTRQRP
jgi:hypothetical protein